MYRVTLLIVYLLKRRMLKCANSHLNAVSLAILDNSNLMKKGGLTSALTCKKSQQGKLYKTISPQEDA
jgi:hypothetical protein